MTALRDDHVVLGARSLAKGLAVGTEERSAEGKDRPVGGVRLFG